MTLDVKLAFPIGALAIYDVGSDLSRQPVKRLKIRVSELGLSIACAF